MYKNTILDWLLPSMKKLADAGVDSPRRDCLVLIEDALGKDRSWVTAHPEHELSKNRIKMLDKQIERRADREPLAYIRGKAWFYGRFFEVDPSVMIPRPESESFIELIKKAAPKSIADIGTGSGCLAITAKLELPASEVAAVDISRQALKVAQKNAKDHKADINFVQGSLIVPLKRTPEAILANLPYVPDGLMTSKELTYEPKTALFSGHDGLEHYKKFWEEIGNLSKKPALILTESLSSQHKELERLAHGSGYKLTRTEVLVQQFEPA